MAKRWEHKFRPKIKPQRGGTLVEKKLARQNKPQRGVM